MSRVSELFIFICVSLLACGCASTGGTKSASMDEPQLSLADLAMGVGVFDDRLQEDPPEWVTQPNVDVGLVDPEAQALVYAAQAAFQAGEIHLEEYTAFSVSGTAQEQTQAVRWLMSRGLALQHRYTDVLAYSAPEWRVAALYRRAHVLHLLATKIKEASPATDLSTSARRRHRAKLQDIIAPIEAMTTQRLTYALTETGELSAASPWVQQINALLANYRQPGDSEAPAMSRRDGGAPFAATETPRGPSDS